MFRLDAGKSNLVRIPKVAVGNDLERSEYTDLFLNTSLETVDMLLPELEVIPK
jgi:hypothetical protein